MKQEILTLVSLACTVVISNFAARAFMLKTGVRLLGTSNRDIGAFGVTVIAVGCEAAYLSWDAPTVTSVLVALICAFFVIHLPERREQP